MAKAEELRIYIIIQNEAYMFNSLRLAVCVKTFKKLVCSRYTTARIVDKDENGTWKCFFRLCLMEL
jgi:hypothetical protein